MPSKRGTTIHMALLAAACSGGDEAPVEAAAAPLAPAGAEAADDQAAQQAVDDSIRANEMQLARETFSYAGGTRDPFSSLFNLASAGPEIQDLELVCVYLDPDRPGNTVALLRERATGRPHKLRLGDVLGRARVAQIRRTDIVFTIEDFGFERQETLALPKREEGTQ